MARTWGDCYGYLLVATGRAEVMVDPVLNPWDIACFIPIIEEAGGVFTDLAGRADRIRRQRDRHQSRAAPTVRGTSSMLDLDALDFSKGGGLVTVVAQDATTGAVLMVAHADREALERTLSRRGDALPLAHARRLAQGRDQRERAARGVAAPRIATGTPCSRACMPAGPACHTGARAASGPWSGDALTHPRGDVIAARAAERPLTRPQPARVAAPAPPATRGDCWPTATSASRSSVRRRANSSPPARTAMPRAPREETADLFYHALVALAGGRGFARRRACAARRAARLAHRS